MSYALIMKDYCTPKYEQFQIAISNDLTMMRLLDFTTFGIISSLENPYQVD